MQPKARILSKLGSNFVKHLDYKKLPRLLANTRFLIAQLKSDHNIHRSTTFIFSVLQPCFFLSF